MEMIQSHRTDEAAAPKAEQEQSESSHMLNRCLPPPISTDVTARQLPRSHQQQQQQHMPDSPQQTLSYNIQSPPLASKTFHSAGSPLQHNDRSLQHQQPTLPLSPRPLAVVPGYSPPSYSYSQQHDHNHDPSTLNLPKLSSTELAPLQLDAQEQVDSLPSLASLTGSSSAPSDSLGRSSTTSDSSYSPRPRPQGWPSGNPYSAYYSAGHGQSADSPGRMDLDIMSSDSSRGPLSPDSTGGRASSVSMDDPDVKMAAEALGALKANFVSSPMNRASDNPALSNYGTLAPNDGAGPLLKFVMSSGSILSGPIEGTVTAYNTTKNRSPSFIKGPVERVEAAVGQGLHITGIEGGIRWLFHNKARQHSSSDIETGESSNKRRKVNSDDPMRSEFVSRNGGEVDHYGFASTNRDRRLSMSTVDSLPIYDSDARSPAYTETTTTTRDERDRQATPTASRPSTQIPKGAQAWVTGLTVAMSNESLRSLKYCLTWLRMANDHLGATIDQLKDLVKQYESQGQTSASEDDATDDDPAKDPARARQELCARITALRGDVLGTLQGVIETVSKYAGGALPDQARNIVRRHLTSLPARFRSAARESSVESGTPSSHATEEGEGREVREGAQRVMLLATQGLEMMAQVSGVLNQTIVSAEDWCDKLGKKRPNDPEAEEGPVHQKSLKQEQHTPTVPFTGVGVPDADVKMG